VNGHQNEGARAMVVITLQILQRLVEDLSTFDSRPRCSSQVPVGAYIKRQA